MKMLLLGTALGLCTLPAMAAGPLAMAGHTADATSAGTGSAAMDKKSDLPLPPVDLGGTISAPGFGSGSSKVVHSAPLPGLGLISMTTSNPGKGKGEAALSGAISIDPESSHKPTELASGIAVP